MIEPRTVTQPPGTNGLIFRRRTDDALAEVHEESQRLIAQAKTVRQEWLDAQARVQRVQREVRQRHSPAPPARPDASGEGIAEAQQALAQNTLALALERELARSRRLEDEVLAIQDQERARMARDLHDGICQELSGVGFLLHAHLRQLEAVGPDFQGLQTGRKIQEVLTRTNQQLRSLSHGLSGVDVGARGENLCAVLTAFGEQINAYESVRCEVACAAVPDRGSVAATHLYRIVQEAVGNALRHGRAGRIEIRLAHADDRWCLSVEDDGVGVPDKEASPGSSGLGLRSMEYRAAVLGGVLEVRRATKAAQRPGTLVRCTFA